MSSKEGSRSDINPVILFHTSASISTMLNPSNIERSKEKILFTKSINIVIGANNSPIRLPNPLNKALNKPPINLNGARNIFLINPTTILMPPKIASVILNSFNPLANLSNPKNPRILATTFFKNVTGNVTMSRINPPIVSSIEPVDENLSFMFLNAVTIPPTNNAIPAATATNGAAAIRNPLIATPAPTAKALTAVPMPVATAPIDAPRAVRPVPSNVITPLIPPAEAVAKRFLALRNIVDLVNANAAAYKSWAFLIPAATLDITPNLIASTPSIALNARKLSANIPMNPNTSPDSKAPRALNASARISTTKNTPSRNSCGLNKRAKAPKPNAALPAPSSIPLSVLSNPSNPVASLPRAEFCLSSCFFFSRFSSSDSTPSFRDPIIFVCSGVETPPFDFIASLRAVNCSLKAAAFSVEAPNSPP